MKGKLYLYYDEEGDFLEINMGEYSEGYFKNMGKGIFKRITKDGNITGIAVAGFKKRTKKLEDLKIHLPIKMEIIS